MGEKGSGTTLILREGLGAQDVFNLVAPEKGLPRCYKWGGGHFNMGVWGTHKGGGEHHLFTRRGWEKGGGKALWDGEAIKEKLGGV